MLVLWSIVAITDEPSHDLGKCSFFLQLRQLTMAHSSY